MLASQVQINSKLNEKNRIITYNNINMKKIAWFTNSRGVGHGSRDSIRPIKCRLSRSNGGHIFHCELRIGCRFSTDFCAHHENQRRCSRSC